MTTEPDKETRFTGLPISPGVVVAQVCLFQQNRHTGVRANGLPGKGFDRERARLDRAKTGVIERLEDLRETVARRLGPAEAGILVAQRMMIEDPALNEQMDRALTDGCNAETAVVRTLDSYESQLLELDDAYLRERAGDLGELKHRLLDVLCDTRPSFQCTADAECRRGQDRIVITDELTPAAVLEIETDRLLGFVAERGGATSHAGILARALGIPAVSGIPNIHNLVACGTEVFLDGNTGEVAIRPNRATKARAAGAGAAAPLSPVKPVESLAVMANISVASEVDEALAMEAEGIGLYRTEFEFFTADRLLGEQEQYHRYVRVVKAMGGLPVYFRLLDVGADKASTAFDLSSEDNPSLGCRGARLLLARPELLRVQAKALARASECGPVHVMYPMITGLAQFQELRRLFEDATADLPTGHIRHGVMFEVPAACLEARALLQAADFASIGSNDLVQYLFAVDRNNERVAHDYSPDHDVFWNLLAELADAAAHAGKPLSICGEMASDPTYIPGLLAAGIRTVSISARQIPAVRRAASETLAERGQSWKNVPA